MTVFEITGSPSSFYRAWREIYLLFFFNFGLVIGNIAFFSKYYLIIELCVFGILIFNLFNKRNKQIQKIIFDDKQNVLTISYLQFIFLKFTEIIPYNLLKFNYRYKLYGRGKSPKTLEFIEHKVFVAEIKQKFNLGWTDKEIDCIHETLLKIKQNENNI